MKRNYLMLSLMLTFLIGVLAACQPEAALVLTADDDTIVVTQRPFVQAEDACSQKFVKHTLDHITTNAYKPINMYDSNGAGVAVNDLDGDGDMDIVLANLADENQIFWNEGGLQFKSVAFPYGSSRAPAIVDVDGDNRLDVVFTTRVGSLVYWHNLGNGFEQRPLVGVQEHAYSMAWGDLDVDGDLDLVTGSYDTALEKELRDSFMFGDGAGVFYFENQGNGEFIGERLADTSQALAIELLDINADGRLDILVGNDFDSVQDAYWVATDSGWQAAELFDTTTQNTMSFDVGDINNDGSLELFASDMHPYATDAETEAAWAPVMEMMHMEPMAGDPQRMENVLQSFDEEGNAVNMAHDLGVAYSGWSWSARFGDLDQDGFLDLYVVNGMATSETFAHLPDYELVEENQVYRNNGAGGFAPAPEWGLNDTAGGRGMTMADLDNDGDLDIIINNLLSEAVIFENQLCQGNSLQVDLSWPDIQNTRAIGSRVYLETSSGRYLREVRAMGGYLSGVPTTLHFGFPEDTELERLIIEWVDGRQTIITGLSPNQHLQIQR